MIFSQFTKDDIVAGRINQVSSGLFGSGDLQVSQSLFTTSSTQGLQLTGSSPYDVKNGQYYLDVYYNSEEYFSVAYGDYANSGSSQYDWPGYSVPVLTNETKVIYTQYKNTLLQPGDTLFSFASGSVDNPVDSEAIFAVNFSADKFKDQIDPGQIQLNLSGANGVYSYIDDSQVVNKSLGVYNMISGSIVNGVPTPYLKSSTVQYEGIGLFYPTNGIVILNATSLKSRVGVLSSYNRSSNTSTNQYSTTINGHWRVFIRNFYEALKGTTKLMSVRKSEFVPSTNYFVRVKNKEFNYSNNPTFVSDGTDGQTKGTIIYQDLINNPRTYLTSVGLYDTNNELLAIGKLSRPTQKSFDNELLIKVRIDF
jgi:hypothetical protein